MATDDDKTGDRYECESWSEDLSCTDCGCNSTDDIEIIISPIKPATQVSQIHVYLENGPALQAFRQAVDIIAELAHDMPWTNAAKAKRLLRKAARGLRVRLKR